MVMCDEGEEKDVIWCREKLGGRRNVWSNYRHPGSLSLTFSSWFFRSRLQKQMLVLCASFSPNRERERLEPDRRGLDIDQKKWSAEFLDARMTFLLPQLTSINYTFSFQKLVSLSLSDENDPWTRDFLFDWSHTPVAKGRKRIANQIWMWSERGRRE